MKKTTIIICIIFLFILSLSSCTQSDTIDAYANDFITSCSKGNYEDATKHFSDTLKSKMNSAKIKSFWEYNIKTFGAFSEVTGITTSKKDQNQILGVNCLFEKGTGTIYLTFDSSKKITSISSENIIFNDSPKPPNGVKEADIKIAAGTQFELGGTLSYFENKTEGVTAVILVGGSGPQTRDETSGSQSLYKDVAWGLSTRGVAVLRYDKRTYTYKDKIEKDNPENFTVKYEIIDDVVQAVKALKAQTTVKINKIYILGHDLSAALLPRIAKEVPDTNGYIYMAGFARPLEDLILEQYNYLNSIDKSLSNADKEKANKDIKNKIDLIKNLTDDSTLTDEQLMGTPKSYWLDLKNYNPATAAKEISKPILFLQGEKDYQTSMTDFNLFKEQLSGRFDVKFISYPNLNHMFIITTTTGEKSTPNDYNKKLNVEQKVINDIYSFIK